MLNTVDQVSSVHTIRHDASPRPIEFQAEHHSHSPHIFDAVDLRRQLLEMGIEIFCGFRYPVQETFSGKPFDRSQCSRTGEGVPPECGRMGSRNERFHDPVRGPHGADGHPSAQGLGKCDDVRFRTVSSGRHADKYCGTLLSEAEKNSVMDLLLQTPEPEAAKA